MDRNATEIALRSTFDPDNLADALALWDLPTALRAADPARQAAFMAGRRLARLAMERLAIEPMPVPTGNAGEPLWPVRLAGSISHTARGCRGAGPGRGSSGAGSGTRGQ